MLRLKEDGAMVLRRWLTWGYTRVKPHNLWRRCCVIICDVSSVAYSVTSVQCHYLGRQFIVIMPLESEHRNVSVTCPASMTHAFPLLFSTWAKASQYVMSRQREHVAWNWSACELPLSLLLCHKSVAMSESSSCIRSSMPPSISPCIAFPLEYHGWTHATFSDYINGLFPEE